MPYLTSSIVYLFFVQKRIDDTTIATVDIYRRRYHCDNSMRPRSNVDVDMSMLLKGQCMDLGTIRMNFLVDKKIKSLFGHPRCVEDK